MAYNGSIYMDIGYNRLEVYGGQVFYISTESTVRMLIDTSGNVDFPTANAKISGSATSTGSFGALTIGGTILNANLVSGKVGIGTTNPYTNLHVLGSDSTSYASTITSGYVVGSDALLIQNSHASAGWAGIYFSTDSTQNPQMRIALTNEAGFDGDCVFQFRNPSDTGNDVERMRITLSLIHISEPHETLR